MSNKKISEIVTPARYYRGYTYMEYVGYTGANRARFEELENTFKLSTEDEAAFKKIKATQGAIKVLALVEDWSPDVHRALPVLNKIVHAGSMELRIFTRDKNLDIMDLFLNKGEFRSIPTFVFFSPDLNYICSWIERPAVAVKLYEEIDTELAPKNLPIEERRKIRRERTRHLWPEWQRETVREIRNLITLPQNSVHEI